MVNEPDQFSDFEIRGSFWRRDDEQPLPGTVRVRRGNVTLELSGVFPASHTTSQSLSGFRVYGRSRDLVDLTLDGTIVTASDTVGESTVSELKCMSLHTGLHLKDDTQIISVSFRLTNFEDWLTWHAFKVSESNDGSVSLALGPLPKMQFSLADGSEVTISGLSTTSGTRTQRTVGYQTRVHIHNGSEPTLDYYWKRQTDFRKLVALLLGRAVYTSELTFLTPGDVKVRTYYQQNISDPPPFLASAHIPLPWDFLKQDFKSYLDRWDLLLREADTSIELYLGNLFNDNSYVESQFLALTQALESLHRRFHPGTYVEHDKYNEIKQALGRVLGPMQMPEGLRDALKARIRYGNEFSMRRRLTELIDGLAHNFLSLVTRRSRAEFVERIVETRNQLTHDPTDPPSRPSGQGLYNLMRQIELLTRLVILTRLGLSTSTVGHRMQMLATLSYDD